VRNPRILNIEQSARPLTVCCDFPPNCNWLLRGVLVVCKQIVTFHIVCVVTQASAYKGDQTGSTIAFTTTFREHPFLIPPFYCACIFGVSQNELPGGPLRRREYFCALPKPCGTDRSDDFPGGFRKLDRANGSESGSTLLNAVPLACSIRSPRGYALEKDYIGTLGTKADLTALPYI